MTIKKQSLNSIKYDKLKNLRGLTISFKPHNITAIFGVNGCGKSTILHSLLCIYKPHTIDLIRRNYKFSEFFTPTTLDAWIGSGFDIVHSYQENTRDIVDATRHYEKQDRWTPRYENRPARNVYYIGIDTCVPDIEVEKKTSLIRFSSSDNLDRITEKVLSKMSYILNRQYISSKSYSAANKKYLGVESAGLRYSSLSMGAGEQRLFRILQTVFKASQYSLIIIDEIELTLHTDALMKLINVLKSDCAKNNKQIVFTSHREELIKRKDINIRHIHQTADETICFENSTPECIYRLTGNRTRLLDIFVEDALAAEIVNKIAEQKKIRKHCSVRKFGAIENAFTLASGLVIKNDANIDNCLIVTDGDKYRTVDEKMVQLNKKFSGNEANAEENRNTALSLIKQFKLPENIAPEKFVYEELKMLEIDDEIVEKAKQIEAVEDTHDYLNQIIDDLGYDNYQNIINCFSQSEQWTSYIEDVSVWFDAKIEELNLVI